MPPEAAARETIDALLVAAVRFALQRPSALESFADSVRTRFDSWIEQKATKGTKFSNEQRAWLELIRDRVTTSLAIEPDDFGYSPFLVAPKLREDGAHSGGLGRARPSFDAQLPEFLKKLNAPVAA
jgi:type I restriction enzyme, R subunit